MAQLNEQFDLSTGNVIRADLKQKLQQVDIFWFRLAHKLNSEVIDEETRCRFFVSPVTGIDHIDEELCKRLGISIICLRGETEFLKEVRATAEHTILLAMMLMRNAAPAIEDVENEYWRRDLFRGFELYKKKVGIIGYGRLGKIVADYCIALGCEVGFYDIEKKDSPEQITRFETLEDCISNCDIISIHVPYNPSTHYLIDKTLFQKFNHSKWLINTSRGGIVDDRALLDALKQQRIAGAALDVLYGEPDIRNNALISYAQSNRNLIITPHIGGCTFESFEKTEAFIADKLVNAVYQQNLNLI